MVRAGQGSAQWVEATARANHTDGWELVAVRMDAGDADGRRLVVASARAGCGDEHSLVAARTDADSTDGCGIGGGNDARRLH